MAVLQMHINDKLIAQEPVEIKLTKSDLYMRAQKLAMIRNNRKELLRERQNPWFCLAIKSKMQ